MKTDH